MNNLKVALLIFTAFLLSLDSFSQENKSECRVLLHRISGHYEGGCKNGFAHGKGKAIGIDTYEGRFKKGLPDGNGTYTWKNGNVYTGDWKKGKRSGKGTLYSASNGEEITGYWKNDEFVREIKEPEYRIVRQYNVQNVSVRKIGDLNNKITIKLRRDGKIRSDLKDISVEVSNGVLSQSQYFIYNSVVFPWKCKISFSALTRFSSDEIDVRVEVEIDKPGEWEITVNY